MMNAKHFCKMPIIRKGKLLSLRQMINHVSSHMNALQALLLKVHVQDLKFNHLMLATLEPEMQREWVSINASRKDTPTTLLLDKFFE